MKSIINFNMSANIALLYRYMYEGTNMISYDVAVDYYKCINDNLDNMGSHIDNNSYYINDDIYFMAINENNDRYLVIKPNVNINKAWSKYIGNLSLNVLTASRMYNSFEKLGIIDNNKYNRRKRND